MHSAAYEALSTVPGESLPGHRTLDLIENRQESHLPQFYERSLSFTRKHVGIRIVQIRINEHVLFLVSRELITYYIHTRRALVLGQLSTCDILTIPDREISASTICVQRAISTRAPCACFTRTAAAADNILLTYIIGPFLSRSLFLRHLWSRTRRVVAF